MKLKEGYVYIISNANFEGYYKIGITGNIDDRLRTYQTSSPFRNYKVEYYIKHPNCSEAEKQIKNNMKYFATDSKNEWFKCSLLLIKNRLDETLDQPENVLDFYKK